MTENWKRWMIQTGTVLGVYIALRYLLPMTVPFLLGWLLAVLILPAVRFLERRLHVKRSLGGMFLIFLLAAGMGFLLYNQGSMLLGQAGSFLEYLGIWKRQAGEILDRCCGMAEDLLGIQAEEARDFLLYEIGQFQEQLQNKARPAFFHYLFSTVKGAVALVSGAVIAVVVGILLVREMEELEEKVRNNPFLYRVQAVGRQICQAGGRYLKAQVIIMAVVAALCMAGFWLLGDPWFLLLGLAVGLLDALPFIGTGTVLIPWAIILLLQGSYFGALGHFLLFVVTDLARELLEPRLIGESLGIHPILMLLSVYLGFFFYGIFGFLLGPLTVILVKGIWQEWGLI